MLNSGYFRWIVEDENERILKKRRNTNEYEVRMHATQKKTENILISINSIFASQKKERKTN